MIPSPMFSGAAAPLRPSDLSGTASALKCDVPAVVAVMTVETGGAGGFLSDGSGRPRILFEAEHFSEATHHNFDASHPDISCPTADWRLYRGGAAEYDRLAQAVALDRTAALESTSWGLFQILGSNCRLAGWSDVESFVTAMAASEGAQLMAFASFCTSIHALAAALRAHDWPVVARLYNGPDWARNHYAARLLSAYDLATGTLPLPLRIGCSGPAVVKVQLALNGAGARLSTDGQFGRVTELALMRFQAAHGLTADGVLGRATAGALDIGIDAA